MSSDRNVLPGPERRDPGRETAVMKGGSVADPQVTIGKTNHLMVYNIYIMGYNYCILLLILYILYICV
jgi:hypothetical protein